MKNWLIFPAIVGALLVGVLIGTKSCKGDSNKHITNVSKGTDTIFINKVVQSQPDTVIQYEDKIVYKTVLLKGSHDTIIKEVPKVEVQIVHKFIDRFKTDSSCLDSIKTYALLVKELSDSISSLQQFKVFKGHSKSKVVNVDYAILGREVSNVEMAIKTKNRLEVTPLIGLSYQTNGKQFREFTYKPFLGGTINYSHFSLFGGMLLDTKTNDLNQYILGLGYKKSL
mgnify:FL=1